MKARRWGGGGKDCHKDDDFPSIANSLAAERFAECEVYLQLLLSFSVIGEKQAVTLAETRGILHQGVT